LTEYRQQVVHFLRLVFLVSEMGDRRCINTLVFIKEKDICLLCDNQQLSLIFIDDTLADIVAVHLLVYLGDINHLQFLFLLDVDVIVTDETGICYSQQMVVGGY
jgi:putative Ca2+/H+ antiporter (TMEM165/GDT1 family)